MADAWQAAAERFQAYRLVLPGTPSFVCQPETCTAHCCHAFSVSLGDRERARMAAVEGLAPAEFLELDEDGEPLALPMLQPYLLARTDGHCKMLRPDLRCGAYEGRPNACRLYPHFVVFWDPAENRALTARSPRVQAAIEALPAPSGGLVPLLLGHIECPGFTGPPVTEEEWLALASGVCRLQYEG